MITEEQIKSLMDINRESIKIPTMKWFKSISNSNIIIDERPYTLDISMNKRNLGYSSLTNQLVETSSLMMKDNSLVDQGFYLI
jgi:hypothetical protein